MQRGKSIWLTMSVGILLVVIVSFGVLRVVGRFSALTASAGTDQPGATPAPTQVTPTPTPRPMLPALTIHGTQVVNSLGHVVTLIGVAHSSLEYVCAGDGHFEVADFQAMRSWGINVVRIPLSSAFWANLGNTCPDYHDTVAAAVANAEAAGLYIILDLQWDAPLNLPGDASSGGGQYPMPDAERDVAFWQDLAQIYHSDSAVIFDLFGEPHNIFWSTWYQGGQISTTAYRGNHIGTGQYVYQAIGMRDLVAKVRAIAPDNVLILSGLNWGYDLAGIDPAYLIHDTNILYGTHPFDYAGKEPANWPYNFGNLSKSLPLIATEFGSYNCQTGYTSAAIAYFKAHHMSWLAWGWNTGPCSRPSLLADWSGKPNTPYGAYVRQQMLLASQQA